MTPSEIDELAVRLNAGKRYGSRKLLAARLGIAVYTVKRWTMSATHPCRDSLYKLYEIRNELDAQESLAP